MFLDNWYVLLRIVAVGVPIYFIMIAALRVSGKRALAKMNAYDLIATVALGSVLASTFITKDVKLVDGVVAVAMLLGLQWLVAWTVERWPFAQKLVLSEPRLLLHNGHPIHAAMKKERINEAELLSAVRSSGHMSLNDVQAVVLEPDGTFTVMPKQDPQDSSAMKTVANYNRPEVHPKI